MSRLSRQPCAHCGKDTLFKAITCTECGTIKDIGEGYRAKRNKYIRRVAGIVGPVRAGEIAVLGTKATRKGRAEYLFDKKAHQRDITPNPTGSFGAGRERTRT